MALLMAMVLITLLSVTYISIYFLIYGLAPIEMSMRINKHRLKRLILSCAAYTLLVLGLFYPTLFLI
ncbi:hypothetical protein [Moritella viscosa]|uniref:Uncharacterized protein n=1 Tax=Moritella viscosa TaxID=80854 RepID=A0ABY1HB68_9GAMM|nr:hypothetical protein [Moritella viscosa]SGY89116.1 unnamed protein product [Moritella viscosa]SGY96922.1 unnamed protein product [Moritella viscosa]SHO25759.1 unnamed protein product [Moritella viscosa]